MRKGARNVVDDILYFIAKELNTFSVNSSGLLLPFDL